MQSTVGSRPAGLALAALKASAVFQILAARSPRPGCVIRYTVLSPPLPMTRLWSAVVNLDGFPVGKSRPFGD